MSNQPSTNSVRVVLGDCLLEMQKLSSESVDNGQDSKGSKC